MSKKLTEEEWEHYLREVLDEEEPPDFVKTQVEIAYGLGTCANYLPKKDTAN